MQSFIYPMKLTPDKEEGGVVVTFRDLPEAITQSESIDESVLEAADCLEEAIANRIVSNLPIPSASNPQEGEYSIFLSVQMSAKAALYLTMKEMNISKTELARRLHCDEKEIRRLLNPRHASKLPRIEFALANLGRNLVIGLQEAV